MIVTVYRNVAIGLRNEESRGPLLRSIGFAALVPLASVTLLLVTCILTRSRMRFTEAWTDLEDHAPPNP